MKAPCDCPICLFGGPNPTGDWRIYQERADGGWTPQNITYASRELAEQIGSLVSLKMTLQGKPIPRWEVAHKDVGPTAAPWQLFLHTSDGKVTAEETFAPTKELADALARWAIEIGRTVLGSWADAARYEARNMRAAVTPGPEDITVDVPATLDQIAALRARVSTLVEAEARAIASEKAAREALEKIDTKRIRELVFELRRGQWSNVSAAILAALGDAPVVDHGPNGVGC